MCERRLLFILSILNSSFITFSKAALKNHFVLSREPVKGPQNPPAWLPLLLVSDQRPLRGQSSPPRRPGKEHFGDCDQQMRSRLPPGFRGRKFSCTFLVPSE